MQPASWRLLKCCSRMRRVYDLRVHTIIPDIVCHLTAMISVGMKSTKVQTLGIPTRMRNISTNDVLCRRLHIIKISWQCGTKIMTMFQRLSCLQCVSYSALASPVCSCVSEALMLATCVLFNSSLSKVCSCVSEALMLAMLVLFCSSLSKVCSCVSELLILAMRILLFSCPLNVSSRDSFAFRGTTSSIGGFSFQSEGMTTLTNRSFRVYHCAALRTYLSQAHTCTSVHVPHYTTNNEVNRTKHSLSLSSPLSSDAIFITCHVQLYVPGAVYRRIL